MNLNLELGRIHTPSPGGAPTGASGWLCGSGPLAGESAPSPPETAVETSDKFPKASVPLNRRVPFVARFEVRVRFPLKVLTFLVEEEGTVMMLELVPLRRAKRHGRVREPFRGMVWLTERVWLLGRVWLTGELALVKFPLVFWIGEKVSRSNRVWLFKSVVLNGKLVGRVIARAALRSGLEVRVASFVILLALGVSVVRLSETAVVMAWVRFSRVWVWLVLRTPWVVLSDERLTLVSRAWMAPSRPDTKTANAVWF